MLKGWPPELKCNFCGNKIKTRDNILIFTEAPEVKLNGKKKYIGYDEVAGQYGDNLYPEEIKNKLPESTGEVIADILGEDKIIADIGCGPGLLDIEIAERGHKVIAGDISLQMLKLFNHSEYVKNNSIISCRIDAHKLPFADNSLDAVIGMQLLHFVGQPKTVVREIKRTLKVDGLFIVNGPCNRKVTNDEINLKMRYYYGQALKKRGIDETKSPGWSSREMRNKLDDMFSDKRIVDIDKLQIESRASWFYRRLKNKYSAFQIGISDNVHGEAMKEVENKIKREYGKDFRDIRQDNIWEEKLTIYYV